MPALTIAAIAERAPGERRVALVPEVVDRLLAQGHDVLVERGAGAGSWHADDDYLAVGAKVGTLDDVLAADVVLAVRRPPPDVLARLRSGQALAGLLDARGDRAGLTAAADAGVHVLSLDLLPRTLSRAQSMDALTSQASVAGYRAVLVAAEAFGRFMPMMITAAGTARPAGVLVIGAGVAGLAAIGTARRLGALVTGYDVRPEARADVVSLGASFLATSVDAGDPGTGYARELTAQESDTQRAELAAAVRRADVVISTAQVPGGTPPVLVTASTVDAMTPGSVLVDLAAGPRGGNVVGSVPDERVVTSRGVTVIGAGNLPSGMAAAASAMYARNVAALVAAVTHDGMLDLDPADEVVDAVLVGPSEGPREPAAPAVAPSSPTSEDSHVR